MKRKLHDAKQVFSAKVQTEPQCYISPPAPVETRQLGTPKTQSVEVGGKFTLKDAKGDKKFLGRTLHDLLFVKIFFAGTARLSKKAQKHGIGILPMDKTAARPHRFHSQLRCDKHRRSCSTRDLIGD